MYCYFSEYKKKGLKLDFDFLKTSVFKNDKIISLFTCNRVEFYSLEKLDFLEKTDFIFLDNKDEIYKHFFDVVLWYNSEILFENAIISQVDKILLNYKYKDNQLYLLLSTAFQDALDLRLKKDLFSQNHWDFAMDFILKNDKNKENLIFIGSWAMVQDSLDLALNNFSNVCIVSRSKMKYFKHYKEKLDIISPDNLEKYINNLASFSLFIATTNLNSDYLNILQNVVNSWKIRAIWNICAFNLHLDINNNIPYINMYSNNMKNYINKSNMINKQKFLS